MSYAEFDHCPVSVPSKYLDAPESQSHGSKTEMPVLESSGVSMNSHIFAPIHSRPSATLEKWKIFRVHYKDGTSSCHVVGESQDEYRVTSAIESVYPLTSRVRTRSGQLYKLGAIEGRSVSAEFFFYIWLKKQGSTKCIDESHIFMNLRAEARRKQAARGNSVTSRWGACTSRYGSI